MRIYILFLAFLSCAAMTASCERTVSDDNAAGDAAGSCVWDKSDAVLSGLSGKVRNVSEYLEVEGERHILKSVSFDEQGHVLVYNPLGIDIFGEEEGISTYAYDQETKAYAYSYDEEGRLVSVEEREIGGDAVEYTISYDGSDLMVPFPKMGIADFLLQGVSSISSTDGYSLEKEDGSVYIEYETRSGLFKTKRTSRLTFKECFPVLEEAVYTVSGELAYSETKTYSWYGDGSLSATSEVRTEDGTESSRDLSRYSALFPMCKVIEQHYSEGILQTELNYVYDTHGNLVKTYYTEGYEDPFGFTSVYGMEYVEYDEMGNWTRALRKEEAGETVIFREILYHE